MDPVAIVFGAITIWIVAPAYFAFRSKTLKGDPLDGEARNRLQYLEAEHAKNEARLRNLETIVCDVDMELNAKLNRLATLTPRLPADAGPAALPAPAAERALPARAALPDITPVAPVTPVAGASLKPGDRVGDRFVIKRLIGAGGMVEVFEADDEVLKERVALKVIGGMALLQPDAIERFRREATAARRITHPKVVRLHDIGEDGPLHFISMEYVGGQSVQARLDQHGRLSAQDAASIAEQVCAALGAAHKAGVVHRDLKPHNLLLDERGRYRVIDFGVAKLPYLEGMTRTGVIMGTPQYMAPEQISGKPVDTRADLYALGAIIFHVLTGQPPFSGDTAIAIGFAHCSEPIPRLGDLGADAAEPWQRFVDRAMAKDPAERFASAEEMAAAIP